MKQCPRCGNWLNDFDTYCGRCGYVFPAYNSGYYQAPPFVPVVQQTSPLAVASLVTGIISLVGFCFYLTPIIGILAIIFGFVGKSSIKKSNGMKTGAGMAVAGIVLGITGIVLTVLVYVFLFAVASHAPGSSPFSGPQYKG